VAGNNKYRILDSDVSRSWKENTQLTQL